jgi:catechol 2,3-dioxygenase-like lactoylglutathione lyase family enzyme
MIKRIKTVGLYVEDQDRALAFYTEKLGFEVYADQPMGPKARWIEVGPRHAQTHFVIFPRTMMPRRPFASFLHEELYLRTFPRRCRSARLACSRTSMAISWRLCHRIDDIA